MIRRHPGSLLLILLLCLAFALPASAAVQAEFPKDLKIIDAQAFENITFDSLTIPEGVLRIESRAFAGTQLREVTFCGTLQYIAPDAFDGCDDLTAVAPEGSYAAQWCRDNQVPMYAITPLDVDRHTQDEIRAFIASHPADPNHVMTFRQPPTGGSYYGGDVYAPGLISEESLTEGLNMLNQIRYIAGLNADVTNAPEWELPLAAAALVNALNGATSHSPDRPDVLSDSIYDELYELAREGAGSSNLYASPMNLYDGLLGYVLDPGSSNLSALGHRRWVLHPEMGRTTFGFYYSPDVTWRRYQGMYAFDHSGSGAQNYVAWPAQQTPLTHYDNPGSHPWSLSTNRFLEAEQIEVTLTRRADGRTWYFSAESSDGAFFVNNRGYGDPGCIIFMPNGVSIAAGECYDVFIKDRINMIIFQYTVEFFDP